MYVPIEMEAENMFSFKKMHYTFLNGKTTLIGGKNEDNDSQESNGSGKSSLIECMAIAISGTPIRKVRAEEVINNEAEEGSITIMFKNEARKEHMVITRQMSRKSSSVVSVHILKDGHEVDDKTLQAMSSVDEYNKYILERIGITRDELYNTFILTKHRSEDFLLTPDSKKKLIINQFSRGNLIDQSIGEVEGDMLPIQAKYDNELLAQANISGRVQVLEEQLDEVELSSNDRTLANNKRIEELDVQLEEEKHKISSNRASLKVYKDYGADLNDDLIDFKLLYDEIDEKSKPSDTINTLFDFFHNTTDTRYSTDKYLKEISDVYDSGDTFRNKIKESNERIKLLQPSIQDKTNELEALVIKVGDKDGELSIVKKECDKNKEKLFAEKGTIDEIKDKQESVIAAGKDVASKISEFTSAIDDIVKKEGKIKVKLAGTVVCPKCHYEFLTSDKGFSVEDGKKEIEKFSNEISEITKSIDLSKKKRESLLDEHGVLCSKESEIKSLYNTIDEEFSNKERELNNKYRDTNHLIRNIRRDISDVKSEIESLTSQIKTYSDGILAIENKVSTIPARYYSDIVNAIEDDISNNKRTISSVEQDIKDNEQSISRVEARIKQCKGFNAEDDVVAVKDKLSAENVKLEAKNKVVRELDNSINKYKEQIQLFIDFKTHLANAKIKDLANTTNEFLEIIGSDLRIDLSGYTKLKSGKVRDKISITLLRNGVDEGSFGKFSCGEQARISMATTLALCKLVNLNCDDGGGLDLLILDEKLGEVDARGHSAMLNALNKSGMTCLVISQGLVEEGYPNIQYVQKTNGESKLI